MNAGFLGTLLSLAMTFGAAWLLTYAVHSTALIGSVWLAERAGLLRSLRLRDLAWRTALMGALLTATLQLAAGLTPFGGAAELTAPALPALTQASPEAEPPRMAVVRVRKRPAPAAVEEMGPRRASAGSVPAVPAVPSWAGRQDAAAPSPALSAPSHSVVVPRLSPVGLAFLGWAMVASAFLLRLAVLRARVLTALGERAPVVDPLVRARLEGLCRDVGHSRPVRLTTAAGLRSPVALGWAEICLPAEALLELDAAQQRSVLAHELAHLRRLDPVWLVLGSVLEQLFFFQPLNRVARARMQEVAEFLCDDWAAARNGSGLDVARGLASVAAWLDGRAPSVPLAGMAEHPSQLLARVTRLLARGADEVDRLRPWHVGGMALLLLLTVFIAPGVRAAPERMAPGTKRAGASAPEASLEQTRSVIAVQSLDREVLDGPSDNAAPGGETAASGARAAPAPQPDRARTRAPAPAPDGAPPASTKGTAPEPRTRTSDQPGDHALLDMAPVAAPLLALTDPVPPTAPRAPTPPKPPAPPTAVDVERIRSDAQRMARDAQRQAREAVHRAHARSMGHRGRHGGGRTPADPKTVDALIGALKDGDPGVRQAAAESLGRIGEPRAVDGLSGLLGDGNVEVRRAAVEALGNIEDPKAIPALTRAAGDANPAVRREAAEALLSFDEPAAGEPLIKLLADSDPRVRLTAMEGLSERGDRRALAPLSKLVKDPNVEIRARAVRALSRFRDPSAQEGLVAALKDENAEVRTAAAAGLGELELKAAPQGLLDATRDPSADVRQQAAEALGQIHDPKAVPQLQALLDDSDADVRGAAVEALSDIRDGAALQALITAMQSKDVTVRRAAAQALGQRE
ncbi:MAG TPA: HEAT repeat domain-containing protein [Myxococcaceae bacterium]|nr:HEAT repeat domain-containing protein [Myxococcaceae bacterium]